MKLRSGRIIRRDEEVNSILSVNSGGSVSGISVPIHLPDLVRDVGNWMPGTDGRDGFKRVGIVVSDVPVFCDFNCSRFGLCRNNSRVRKSKCLDRFFCYLIVKKI